MDYANDWKCVRTYFSLPLLLLMGFLSLVILQPLNSIPFSSFLGMEAAMVMSEDNPNPNIDEPSVLVDGMPRDGQDLSAVSSGRVRLETAEQS